MYTRLYPAKNNTIFQYNTGSSQLNFVGSTVIITADDLNTYQTVGSYAQLNITNAKYSLNYPIEQIGKLVVSSSSTTITQSYYTQLYGYIRTFNISNSTWSSWVVTGSTIPTQGSNINCGANEIMELQDGLGQSKLMFAFEFPEWLSEKLSLYNYTVNLQLFDAGTLFAPALPLKEVTLSTFNVDFSEGDGYSYLPPKNLPGISNWIYSTEGNLWSDAVFTPVTTYNLNFFNEDLNFDVTSAVSNMGQNNNDIRFCLEITNPLPDSIVYTKYICSKYTKTVFKPYLEFFISDEVIDESSNCIAGIDNKIYLINQTGNDFAGTITATSSYEGAVPQNLNVINESIGRNYVIINPPIPTLITPTFVKLIWSINSIPIKQQLIEVKTPNQLEEDDCTNLFFYPVTPSTHKIVRIGDILPFKVISQIRGKGNIVNSNYEYKITSADGFEITPWTKISVYGEKMYFTVDTSFFFPEQQYEVWVRNTSNNFSITSNLTYRFKAAMNDKSHMKDLATSPYYSRDTYFSK